MMRPISAQNVASIVLSSGVGGLDGCCYRCLVGLGAQKLLDDLRRGFLGNVADVVHGLGLDRGDAFFGCLELAFEGCLGGSAFCVGFALALFACGFCNRSRLGAGLGQFLLIGSDSVVGILLEAGCLLEILSDAVATGFDHAADARQN